MVVSPGGLPGALYLALLTVLGPVTAASCVTERFKRSGRPGCRSGHGRGLVCGHMGQAGAGGPPRAVPAPRVTQRVRPTELSHAQHPTHTPCPVSPPCPPMPRLSLIRLSRPLVRVEGVTESFLCGLRLGQRDQDPDDRSPPSPSPGENRSFGVCDAHCLHCSARGPPSAPDIERSWQWGGRAADRCPAGATGKFRIKAKPHAADEATSELSSVWGGSPHLTDQSPGPPSSPKSPTHQAGLGAPGLFFQRVLRGCCAVWCADHRVGTRGTQAPGVCSSPAREGLSEVGFRFFCLFVLLLVWPRWPEGDRPSAFA